MAHDPREYSLLDGLSDFWTRFFADTGQLKAFYAATEVQLAQAYFDLMAAFLGISLQDIPLFSKEYFRLIKLREDEVTFEAGTNRGYDRYCYTLATAVTQLRTLQNKVYQPTNALAETTDFDLDNEAYQLRFIRDVTGQVGTVLATAERANLLTYGSSVYAELYVTDSNPFTNAKAGHWVLLANSTVGNNRTFRINTVVDSQRVLLEGAPTLPDPASGALRLTLIDSEFTPITGFARRGLTVTTGGSFDDILYRQRNTEQQSWAADFPIGLGVRKGDILHILDRAAVPTVPGDYPISVVRHDRLYLSTATPVPVNLSPRIADVGRTCTVDDVNDWIQLNGHLITAGTRLLFTCTGTFPGGLTENAFVYARDIDVNTFRVAARLNGPAIDITDAGTGVLTVYLTDDSRSTKLVRDYVILREPADTVVTEEILAFAQTGTPKTGSTASIVEESTFVPPEGCVYVSGGLPPFANSDRQRYVTLRGCGAIVEATCDISIEGGYTIIRRVAGTTPARPFARSGTHGTVTITETSLGGPTPQAGAYTIFAVIENGDAVQLDNVLLTAERVHVDSDVVTNDGTYQIRSVSSDRRRLYLDQPLAYPDATVDAIEWTIHDGYKASLDHTRIRRSTLLLDGGIGSIDTGGYRSPLEGTDYAADYETGTLTQVGRLAGLWSTPDDVIVTRANYHWLKEVHPEISGAVATLRADESEVEVYEVAFWAPDIRVDHFRLYDNFGYLINRFQPSTEDYRQFIRGVFQLYWLGPTLERIESALNIVCSMPVIRDDGETLVAYDASSDPEHLIVKTLRANGDTATYLFPIGTPIREDITSYVPGTSAAITFQSFEPLTTLFQVTDYVQDPTWWDSIILPQELMPQESTWRRTTTPQIYENIVGQIDEPHVGDPGLFVGADETGMIPAWVVPYDPMVSGDSSFALLFAVGFGGSGEEVPPLPAKRRKMANIVVDKYIKRHLFYVHFDATITSLFPSSFLNDLRELVLVAKPGYALCYVEPASNLYDEMQLSEETVQLDVDLTLNDAAAVAHERVLTVGDYWSIGETFRRGGSVPSETLLVADGINVPAPVPLAHGHLTTALVHSPGEPVVPWELSFGSWLPKDYTLDYHTGVLTPLTVWPAGSYSIEYTWYLMTPQASKNPEVGDTDYFVGGPELYFGSLGLRHFGDPTWQVLTEQPLQIAVIPV